MSFINEIFKGKELFCIDAGAAGGLNELRKLRKFINLFSFEPLPDSFSQLNSYQTFSKQFKSHRIFPVALFSKECEANLYITQKPAMSSMLEFDEIQFDFHFGFCKGSKEWKSALTRINTVKIKTTTLDKFSYENKINQIDFLKLDTQGTELEILRGSEQLLNGSRILSVKTEFSNLAVYKNSCVFSEVDIFLKSKGFILIDCIYYPEAVYFSGESSQKTQKKLLQEPGIGAGGDAIYILDKNLISEDRKIIAASILSSMGYTSAAMDYLNPVIVSLKDREKLLKELIPSKKLKEKIKKFVPPVFKEMLRKKVKQMLF